MAGREFSIFLKLSAITAAAVVADICWRIVAPIEIEGDGDDGHEAAKSERGKAFR